MVMRGDENGENTTDVLAWSCPGESLERLVAVFVAPFGTFSMEWTWFTPCSSALHSLFMSLHLAYYVAYVASRHNLLSYPTRDMACVVSVHIRDVMSFESAKAGGTGSGLGHWIGGIVWELDLRVVMGGGRSGGMLRARWW